MTELLRAENLDVGYGKTAVARGVSFSLCESCHIAAVGPNGSGKTTLLRTLAGIQHPLGGILRRNPSLVPGDTGYLPQQSPVQRDFPATAREVARSGCQALRGLRPFFRAAEKNLADRSLAIFGAAAFASEPYGSLSGGQRQRVLLARALCAGRRMLLLDEPATGLDPTGAAEMYGVLADLRKRGMAIFSVTHDLPAGIEDATHVLETGPEPFFGTKEEWMKRKSVVCPVCGDDIAGDHHHHGAGCRHGCGTGKGDL